MANEQKIKIALVRGDSLNIWEGGLWSKMPEIFSVTGFSAKKKLYKTMVSFPVISLPSSSDFRFLNKAAQLLQGRFQWMFGLEKYLSSFDIAHTCEVSYYCTKQAVDAKKMNPKLKVVATVWDNSFGRFEYNYWSFFKSPPSFWRNKINRIIQENIRGVDMFLPVSESSAAMLADYGVDEQKIKILVPAIIPSTISGETVLRNLGLDKMEIYLAVNRLVKEKGIYDILYAWKGFLMHSPDKIKQLCFIGNGPELHNLSRLITDFGLDASVRIIPFLPNNEVRALYAQARCLLLGSVPNSVWQEQFGYVLAEAISSGCPVIATYSGAISEVVGGAGILVPPLNPPALRRALIELSNGDKREYYQKKCSEESKKFAANQFVENLTSIYNSLCI